MMWHVRDFIRRIHVWTVNRFWRYITSHITETLNYLNIHNDMYPLTSSFVLNCLFLWTKLCYICTLYCSLADMPSAASFITRLCCIFQCTPVNMACYATYECCAGYQCTRSPSGFGNTCQGNGQTVGNNVSSINASHCIKVEKWI